MARTKSGQHKSNQGMMLRSGMNCQGCSRAPAKTQPPDAPHNTSDRVLRSHTAQAATLSKVSKRRRRRRRQGDPWNRRKKANQQPPKPRAPPATHYTCRICIEEQTIDEFVRWPSRRDRLVRAFEIPYRCFQHLGRNPRKKQVDPVCKTCIGRALSARLDTLGPRQIGSGCLEPDCTEVWNHGHIMRWIPKGEALEKFNMEMLNVWMQDSTPKPIACIEPSCRAIGVPDVLAPGYPQVVCHECSIRWCAQCHVPWHEDVTCSEHSAKHVNEQMTDSEKETLELMQLKDGRRCPNCQLVIEKDGGCDSMFCLGCKKYFGWNTAASAILGTKKPLPFIRDLPYWQSLEHSVCEMDAILQKAGGAGPMPLIGAAAA